MTKAQAVAFGELVHRAVRSGKARSVNHACKRLNKHRKTLDRFKHIYYMSQVNKALLDAVSARCNIVS